MDPFTVKEISTASHGVSEVPSFKEGINLPERPSLKDNGDLPSLSHDIPDFSHDDPSSRCLDCDDLKKAEGLPKDVNDSFPEKWRGHDTSDTISDEIDKRDMGTMANENVEPCDVKMTDIEGINKRIPKSEGTWTGEPGNSTWVPDKDAVPKVYNPDEKTWGQILEENEIGGIDFNDGEPDFSTVAEETVEIDDYSEDRSDNYDAADEALADKWNAEAKDGKTDWTKEDIAKYREDNKLSWHECADMKTMQLVPREIHLNVPHEGGISMAKNS